MMEAGEKAVQLDHQQWPETPSMLSASAYTYHGKVREQALAESRLG